MDMQAHSSLNHPSNKNQVDTVRGGASSAVDFGSCRTKEKSTSATTIVGDDAKRPAWHRRYEKDDNAYIGYASRQKVNSPCVARLPRVIALVLGLLTLVSAALGLYFWIEQKNLGLTNSQSENAAVAQDLKAITLVELSQHADPLDCWLAIHGFVWDLTDYAPRHPGGSDYVTNYCGQDATYGYDAQHPFALLDSVAEAKVGTFSTSVPSTESPIPAVVDNPVPKPTEIPASGVSPSTSPCFTLTEVQQHASRDDCWYMLYGEVWDFTDYIDKHPGGAQRVYDYCGGGTLTEQAYGRVHNQNLVWNTVPQHYLGPACN